MKVALFETTELERAACLRLAPMHEVWCRDEPLDGHLASAFSETEILSVFVHSEVSAEVLRRLPALRFIVTRSTGYDHIDLAYCAEKGIVVSNVPDYGASTVAEHAFALLLAISRNLICSVERTRRGDFAQGALKGFELREKVFGVVGAGRIGQRTIEIAKGFGMDVVAFDVQPDTDAAARLGFRYVSFEDLLRQADVVSLHVPSTHETVRLISDRALGLMKSGAVLINTARGDVVDVPALVRALANGRLRAAGLDVLPQEPLIRDEAEIFRQPTLGEHDFKALVANHVLLQFPNVVVTPHNAYNTAEAVGRIIETTLQNIEAFVRGAPRNVVITDRRT